MIQREQLQALRKWGEGAQRKPLVLRGARQVGKTTLVNEFAREFDTYLYLNLERKVHRDLFGEVGNTSDLLMNLSLALGKSIQGRTLLFIDEIQASPSAVQWLRYLYEDAPHIHVIAAGSLLESMLNVHVSFPVGRVQYMMLRPLSFLEFLDAEGKTMLRDAIKSRQISGNVHDLVLDEFKKYSLVGGMPEVVSTYSATHDVVGLATIYDSLLTSYRDDVEKYAHGNQHAVDVIRHVLSNGWKEAATRITLQGFANSKYKSREMGQAFTTLEKTHLLELCYPTTSTVVPIMPEQKRAPKLLWVDTGLVNYVAGMQLETSTAQYVEDSWRGRIAEHIVGQELLTLDDRASYHRNFWVRGTNGSTSEVDYVIEHRGLVIPVEVKSGSNSKQKSLGVFMDHAPHNIGIRVSSQPFEIKEWKTPGGRAYRFVSLPYYYVGVIHDILDDLVEQQV